MKTKVKHMFYAFFSPDGCFLGVFHLLIQKDRVHDIYYVV